MIFEQPPPNVRKIVLATNMAEASITINDVVFVVDCGKAKETTYDALNNTPCLLPSWISKASARQVSALMLISCAFYFIDNPLYLILVTPPQKKSGRGKEKRGLCCFFVCGPNYLSEQGLEFIYH